MLYAQVVLPLAQPMYTFSLDEGLAVGVGDAVVVQFGSSRFYTGIVWSITSERPDYPRLKPIIKRLYSTPLLTPEAQRLWEWIAEYYMCTVGEVMRVALPALAKPSATSLSELDERSIEPPTETFIALAEELRSEEALAAYVEKHARRAPRRTETMDRIAALAIERGSDDGFVPRRLVDADAVHIAELKRRGLAVVRTAPVEPATHKSDFLLPTLSEAQQRALDAIDEGHNSGKVALLHGVTGSGKTFTIANVIKNIGKPTLILSHNKTLAAQLYSEFKNFFPNNAVEYYVSYYDYYQPEAYVAQTDTYIEKDSDINDEIDKLRH